MEVELPEEELGRDARERVRDEEERFEVAPREVEGDLAPQTTNVCNADPFR